MNIALVGYEEPSQPAYMCSCALSIVCGHSYIDNHDNGYIGMAVQLYVASSFGTLPHLESEGIQPKTDGIAEIYAPILPIYAQFELLKTCRKHNTTTCESTYFVLTD